jgi:hypothetical protein
MQIGEEMITKARIEFLEPRYTEITVEGENVSDEYIVEQVWEEFPSALDIEIIERIEID